MITEERKKEIEEVVYMAAEHRSLPYKSTIDFNGKPYNHLVHKVSKYLTSLSVDEVLHFNDQISKYLTKLNTDEISYFNDQYELMTGDKFTDSAPVFNYRCACGLLKGFKGKGYEDEYCSECGTSVKYVDNLSDRQKEIMALVKDKNLSLKDAIESYYSDKEDTDDETTTDNPFIERYRCACGLLKGKEHEDEYCNNCCTDVKYVEDNDPFTEYDKIITNYKTKDESEEKEMNKKYELLEDDHIEHNGRDLYRIRALRSFNDIEKGALGGYIESEDNLSHEGNCWISSKAIAYDNASVLGNARVCASEIYGNAVICDNANVYDSMVFGDAEVYNYASVLESVVLGSGKVYGHASVNHAIVNDIEVYGFSKIIDYDVSSADRYAFKMSEYNPGSVIINMENKEPGLRPEELLLSNEVEEDDNESSKVSYKKPKIIDVIAESLPKRNCKYNDNI